MAYRNSVAPHLQLGTYIPPKDQHQNAQLVGFITATATASTNLTHDAMDVHEPNGQTICIHSVCVSPEHRRKGIALRLLNEYVTRLKKLKQQDDAVALAKRVAPHHVALIAHEVCFCWRRGPFPRSK